MTKRDFFRLLIKIFALYALLITVFTLIPNNIFYTLIEFQPLIIIGSIGFVILVILLYYFIIKKTDWIIDITKIDKGFDDDKIILEQLNSKVILNLGIILIGGIILITNLTEFIQYSYLSFKYEIQKQNTLDSIFGQSFGSDNDYFNWTFTGINVIIGYLLISNYQLISRWIEKRERK